MKDFSTIILKNWKGIKVRADIDEKIDDIVLAIQYDQHGDEFLVIRTTTDTYIYGWFHARKAYPTEDDECIRKPKLFYNYDYSSELSNAIYHYIKNTFVEDDYFREAPRLEDDPAYAQRKLDKFFYYVASLPHMGIIYKMSSYELDDIRRYMKTNGIDTEENLKVFEKLPTEFGTIDGAHGISGKQKYAFDRLEGDNIAWIYYKGKELDIQKVRMIHDWDNWCVETFNLSLKQFK